MSDLQPDVPHFLRVVRALARVRGAAIPLAAATTTIVSGVYCGAAHGFEEGPRDPPHCTTNGDCAVSAGEVCFMTVCLSRSQPACQERFECGAGSACDDGVCLFGGASCKSDGDCASTFLVCAPSVGICVPGQGPCAGNADCGGGQTCDTALALCVTVPDGGTTPTGTGGGPVGVLTMPDGGGDGGH
jgi:hypothetical protein